MKRFDTEKSLQKEILSFLRHAGIFAWRQNIGATKIDNRFIKFGHPGISDIIGILPDGRFLAIEVKLEGRKTTRYQEMFLETIRENGGVAIVARSLYDVMCLVKEMKGKCLIFSELDI